MPETTHAQLKAATKIMKKAKAKPEHKNDPEFQKLPESISEFSRNLVNPQSKKKGVSHTAVIRVAQGLEETDWIASEIKSLILKAKRLDPDYFEAETKFLVS